jgi:phage gp36-like protein
VLPTAGNKMLQNLIVKPPLSTIHFSLNMPGVDDIFPGLVPGDFAVLYGSRSVVSLTSLLCVRAQLPVQLGGLASNVIFIDGGNTFRLYNIARFAQLHHLNPREALERIFISRAFTAYQLTSLVMEKLEEAIKVYDAKLVVISDVAEFFLDSDVAAEEAQSIYRQLVAYLSNFAKGHQVVIVATYLPHESEKRNTCLQEITFSKANTVLRFARTKYGREVALEKHPSYKLGVAELPSENLTLTDFMGSNTVQADFNAIRN